MAVNQNQPIIFGPTPYQSNATVDESGNQNVVVAEPLPAGGNVVGKVDINSITMPTTLRFGKVTVNPAGTRVQLSAVSVPLTNGVTIRALSTNGGLVYVGDVTLTSTNGFQLSAGQEVVIIVDNLNKIYIDVGTNGEGVTYMGT